MSECRESSYTPLFLLAMLPLLIVLISSDNDNDLLTDEQKIEKQKKIAESQQKMNEDIKSIFSKDSIIMLLPAPIFLIIGISYFNSHRRNNTLFVFLVLFGILYGLWYFYDFDPNVIVSNIQIRNST